jgi:hypothetical protein
LLRDSRSSREGGGELPALLQDHRASYLEDRHARATRPLAAFSALIYARRAHEMATSVVSEVMWVERVRTISFCVLAV